MCAFSICDFFARFFSFKTTRTRREVVAREPPRLRGCARPLYRGEEYPLLLAIFRTSVDFIQHPEHLRVLRNSATLLLWSVGALDRISMFYMCGGKEIRMTSVTCWTYSSSPLKSKSHYAINVSSRRVRARRAPQISCNIPILYFSSVVARLSSYSQGGLSVRSVT